MKLSFALAVVLSCVAFVASQNATSATDTVPFTDVFPTSTPDDGTVTFDDEFDGDTGTMEANTTSTLPDGTDPDTTAFGEVFIYSPNENAVSSVDDLETDWVIPTGVCNATSEGPQTVPIYCSSTLNGSTCAHVMIGGAENTIIKMPASCGAGPYARVASLNVHPTPSALGLSAEQLAQKPTTEAVYVLTFDYDFSVIPDENGPILMRADISDIPGYWDEIVDAPDDTARKRGIHAPRSLEPRWSGSFEEWLAKMNDIQKSATASRTFHWKDTWAIFEAQVTCPSVGLVAAIDALSVKTQYGFYIEATVVPPAINSAYVFVSATPTVKALFALAGGGSVTYTSEKVTFANIRIPRIICVCPNSVLKASRLIIFFPGLGSSQSDPVSSSKDTSRANFRSMVLKIISTRLLTTSVSRTFPTVTFSLGNSSADFFSVNVSPSASDQGTEIVASETVELSGNMSIHIVPSFELGLSVLNGVVLDAQVGTNFPQRLSLVEIILKAFVAVDLSGGMHINGSVSNTEAPQFCIGADFGVSVDGGLKGDVLFWETGNLTHNFFRAQDEIFWQAGILFLLIYILD
ncbi:hypothetical protein MSAN_00679200 [Mycena sanguinolenta]|uniref:Uncharacterized protein n=1 Tax=Mycena sanguinolenta TaxID=230812 RepID=A0A8H6Z4M6_9AGAR|nr:hypothetical protein MSAN_00679200 [Mycena sanguinolenta]